MTNNQLKGVQPTYKISQADNNVEALKELQKNSIGFIAVCSPCSNSFPSEEVIEEAISEEHLLQSYRVLKRGNFMSLFVSNSNDYEVKKLAEKTGFKIVKTIVRIFQHNNVSSFENCIILRKPAKKEILNVDFNRIQDIANDNAINDTSTSNTVYINSGIGANRNTKPISLIKQLIETFLSKNKNETVLDFFHDTGVTALACIESSNGCNYLGIEQDYSKCEQSITLIEDVIKHEKRQIRLDIQNMRKPFEKRFTLHNGNCLHVLKQYPDNYFDSIVCDPPYGISFLNLGWDHGVPPVEIWTECLRVLKPGGYLAAFADSSTHDIMSYNIRMAGFEILPMLSWLCASTKHKGYDISKGIDKKLGREADRPIVKTIKNMKLVTKAYHRETEQKPEYHVTTAASEEAKQYEGCSTALKVACEPITLARKPFTGSFADNALEHGTGALNIGACAIPNHPELDKNRDTLRIPSNVIHDGSDAVLEMLGEKARYFYCAKVTKEDRNSGLDPIADKHLLGKHPTVKPHELMKWLVTLLNPVTGMKTLDPFMGSGSTGKAAMALTELDLHFTGIDLDPEFCEIAEKRIVDTLNRDNKSVLFSPAKEIKLAPETQPLKKAVSSSQETQITNEQVSKTANVKWFGGLGKSTNQIKSLLPKRFNRYIEPLSGSGSLLFDLENKQGVVNDPNREFVAFHQLLQSSDSTKLVDYLEKVQNERDRVNQSVFQSALPKSLISQFKGMCSNPSFERYLKQEVGKLKPDSELSVIKTAVHQALYYSYRDIYNQKRDSFCSEHIATWFVLRELAYSGMVRFNKKGKFNVPYGKSLNGKNLIGRLKNIIQSANKDFYKKVTFCNSDISHFFSQYNNLSKSDFVFINTTANTEFEHSKILELPQIRSAKTMLIVKNSPDIRSLYSQSFKVHELSSKHLLITNYDQQESSINDTALLSYDMKEAA